MSKRIQPVTVDLKFDDGTTSELSGIIPGTNDKNLQSKITAVIRKLLIGHSLDNGGTITIKIAAAEVDKFTNVER
jgi:hypothetical protein